jgi:DNA-binding response OmpR family regulator
LLRLLRAVSRFPLIVATARDAETEIVRVLDAGADDYVVKPYGASQIDARIRAILRRSGGPAGAPHDPAVTVGGLAVDLAGRRVHLDGTEVDLTPREFDLLAHLVERPGEVVTKRDLLVEVWRQPWGGSDKTVDVHLSWLRRKLGETAAAPRYLTTVRGVGVRLAAPVADAPAPTPETGQDG